MGCWFYAAQKKIEKLSFFSMLLKVCIGELMENLLASIPTLLMMFSGGILLKLLIDFFVCMHV